MADEKRTGRWEVSKVQYQVGVGWMLAESFPPKGREHPKSNLGAVELQAVVLPPESLGIKPGLTEPGAISRTRVRVVSRVNLIRDRARLQPRG
jgi:hypothetical protein